VIEKIGCEQCNDSLLLFIDNEIEDSAIFGGIAVHLQECPGCREIMEYERYAANLIKDLLGRSCRESAPSSLQERIAETLRALEQEELGYSQTEIITQYRRTEIIIDGERQIEIETSHEIRRDFPF
jgi:mycothiol system anti-sigma-R factor